MFEYIPSLAKDYPVYSICIILGGLLFYIFFYDSLKSKILKIFNSSNVENKDVIPYKVDWKWYIVLLFILLLLSVFFRAFTEGGNIKQNVHRSVPSSNNLKVITNSGNHEIKKSGDVLQDASIKKETNDKLITIQSITADPNTTIYLIGLMLNDSKGIKKLQDLVLSKQCADFSKLFDLEAKKLNMGDGTTITRIEAINSPKESDTTKTYIPHYDPKIEESAGICVKSLINNGLINPNKKGDVKLIEELRYKDI